jgi:molybdate transport system regulatory protein
MDSSKLKLNYKFWIETEDETGLLGEGKWLLLKAIRDTGSLKAGIERRGYAYRQTWEKLKVLEERLGFKLIEKSRGGVKGGETVLTAKGEKIVEFFDKLYGEIDNNIQDTFYIMVKELNDIID